MPNYSRVSKAYIGFKSNGLADLLSDNMEVVNGSRDGVANAASTVSCMEFRSGPFHQTVITLAAFPVTAANTSGASFGTAKLYDFPECRIGILGSTASLAFNWAGTSIDAAGSGDWSLGTTGTSDATLASTDVDLCPSVAMTDPAVAGVAAATGGALAAAAQFDGTSTAKDAYLNVIIDDADVADGTSAVVLVTGTIRITWVDLGDY